MIYRCCDQDRRTKIEEQNLLNGIDYLDVVDSEAATQAERQRILRLRFLKPLPSPLTVPSKDNIRIDGGERITDVAVEVVALDPVDDHVVVVTLDRYGDFSQYTLSIVTSPDIPEPPVGFDAVLSSIAFSFKVECPNDFDCRAVGPCPPEPFTNPDLDYLAKDYASFRRLMLDRTSFTAPQWKDRNSADLGVALVEMLAYVGDRLSYRQDAVATEAYFGIARRRASVRRHARLVDYFMHDGCNARAWIQFQVKGDVVLPKQAGNEVLTYRFLTKTTGLETCVLQDSRPYQQALGAGAECFELLEDAEERGKPILLYEEHNAMSFYTWANRECCLTKGATSATLKGHRAHLRPNDVLVFEELKNPRTGEEEDADPGHRHAVRLTTIAINDRHNQPLQDPLTSEFVTEIAWQEEDALPFPLCISSTTDASHGDKYIEDVSVARGNMVLADHGRTVHDPLGTVPPPFEYKTTAPGSVGSTCFDVQGASTEDDWCVHRALMSLPPRFTPTLTEGPITQVAGYSSSASAAAAMQWKLRDCVPSVSLKSQPESRDWEARRDLLNSSGDDLHFVVEIETDGKATLRFGNDTQGLRPGSGETFDATYRVGIGFRGNVGSESLAHLVFPQGAPIAAGTITVVRNPMPAQGGREPETIEEVRQRAPYAFRTQERAVTEADYAEVTERLPEIQKAMATFRWTGSWYTVFLTPDRLGGQKVDDGFKETIRKHVNRYRMAGHDLEIDTPLFVPLEIEMSVCAKSGYFRSCVKKALLNLFSNSVLPDGRRGIFHPDNFTFGQTVYVSRLYAAAQAVEGVQSVEVNLFQQWHAPGRSGLQSGFLEMGRLEIPRLDNNPNFPEHGVFRVTVRGGK